MDNYATHVPVLVAAIELSPQLTGRILELGCGNYSTMLLHNIAHYRGYDLLTFDNNGTWMKQFMGVASDRHRLKLIDDWAAVAEIDEPCDVAFADHGPASRRNTDIERLAENAGIVVVHDTEPGRGPGRLEESVKPFYKYHYTCRRWKAWTSVCSNTIDVTVIGDLMENENWPE